MDLDELEAELIAIMRLADTCYEMWCDLKWICIAASNNTGDLKQLDDFATMYFP